MSLKRIIKKNYSDYSKLTITKSLSKVESKIDIKLRNIITQRTLVCRYQFRKENIRFGEHFATYKEVLCFRNSVIELPRSETFPSYSKITAIELNFSKMTLLIEKDRK